MGCGRRTSFPLKYALYSEGFKGSSVPSASSDGGKLGEGCTSLSLILKLALTRSLLLGELNVLFASKAAFLHLTPLLSALEGHSPFTPCFFGTLSNYFLGALS